jgi:DNA modification methylase
VVLHVLKNGWEKGKKMINWKLEEIQIKLLKEHPKNPRQIKKDQFERLGALIDKFGLIDKPIVNKDLTIIGGHQRIRVLKKKKVKFVECWVAEEQLSDEQVDELCIGLNLHQGSFDFDILANEWDPIDLLNYGFTEEQLLGECKPDITDVLGEDDAEEQIEPPKKEDAITKPGDLYILGEHLLICGDSTDPVCVSRVLDGKEVSLCFTSPPYSDIREYKSKNDLSAKHLSTCMELCCDIIDYFVINLGIKRKEGEIITYWNDWIDTAKSCGIKLLSWNVWDQGFSGSVGKLTAMFPICHEFIFVLGSHTKKIKATIKNKNSGKKNNHIAVRQKDGTILKKQKIKIREYREMGSVYRSPPQLARDSIDHPARFPVQFPEEYIQSMTDPGDCVYDPFLGSGTTLIAAERLGRKCIGIEISTVYCDVIVQRYINFMEKQGKKPNILRNGEVFSCEKIQ